MPETIMWMKINRINYQSPAHKNIGIVIHKNKLMTHAEELNDVRLFVPRNNK